MPGVWTKVPWRKALTLVLGVSTTKPGLLCPAGCPAALPCFSPGRSWIYSLLPTSWGAETIWSLSGASMMPSSSRRQAELGQHLSPDWKGWGNNIPSGLETISPGEPGRPVFSHVDKGHWPGMGCRGQVFIPLSSCFFVRLPLHAHTFSPLWDLRESLTNFPPWPLHSELCSSAIPLKPRSFSNAGHIAFSQN